MTAPVTVEDLLRQCQHTAIHLEMRDGYMPVDPELDAWRAGVRHSEADKHLWWHAWESWYEVMNAATSRGVVARRARIVSEPVSEYIRYEYDVTFANILTGEDVRWLPRHRATDIPLPGNDFWLFDGRVLLINHFAGNGDFVRAEVLDSPDVTKLCSSAFEAVWERATPHSEYRPA